MKMILPKKNKPVIEEAPKKVAPKKAPKVTPVNNVTEVVVEDKKDEDQQ